MKKYSFLLLTVIALTIFQLPRLAQAGAQSLPSKEFKKTIGFEPGGDFTLKTDKGSVRLTSWDSSQIEIYARIVAAKEVSEDYGRRSVEGARVEVSGDGSSLTVRSDFDGVPTIEGFINQSKRLPDIHYEIRAPRSLNINIEADRCKVEVQGFKGEIRLDTDRTPVKASDLEGQLRVNMDRGEATFSNLRGRFDIETDRTNGTLRSLRIEGDSRLEIDRGDFELRLAESQGLNISADFSRKESFDTDFGLTMKTRSGNSFEGAINGGGPRFSIQADRSRISLKRE
ncbi:MAG TPA: hypothetical protein VLR90_15130 [Blastocatellia bacterium]|nr:hypothetical protein [Blastocatellia bacterium]